MQRHTHPLLTLHFHFASAYSSAANVLFFPRCPQPVVLTWLWSKKQCYQLETAAQHSVPSFS